MRRTTVSNSYNHRRRGNAGLEFAISGTLVISLLLLTFRFGYAFYVYNKLEGTVVAGARYASRLTYDSSTSSPSQAYKTAVENMVVYGNPSGGTQPLIPGLTRSNVALTVTVQNAVPKQTRVSIVNFALNTPTQWNLSGKPFAEFRYMGRFAP
jgi:Flp pilus assembly protein TadG